MTPPAGNEDAAAPPHSIVLIGPMGAGKSSIARELAKRTGWRWVDTDRLAAQQAGLPIAEIFARHGEAHFRDLEADAVRSVEGRIPLIVATGGGVIVRAGNAELLRALGCVVWLTASEDVLFERVSRNRQRPLLETEDPRATMHALLAAREPLYAACAHLKIDTSSLSHAAVAEVVLAQAHRLGSQPPVPDDGSMSPSTLRLPL